MNVLFVCVNNAGRSQMAEAFLNHIGRVRGLDIHAESAGTLGVGALHPLVSRAMESAGVSMEGCTPKQVTSDMVSHASRIVSLDTAVDGERCQSKFVVTENWMVSDPAGQALGTVCQIRDQIMRKVEDLLDEVEAKPSH